MGFASHYSEKILYSEIYSHTIELFIYSGVSALSHQPPVARIGKSRHAQLQYGNSNRPAGNGSFFFGLVLVSVYYCEAWSTLHASYTRIEIVNLVQTH